MCGILNSNGVIISLLTVLTVTCAHGSASAPSQIWTPQDLQAVALDPGAYLRDFELMADIDMTGIEMPPIANSTPQMTGFTGTFSGNGHKIMNLTMTGGYYNTLGLFYRAANGAVIENVILENVNIVSTNINGSVGGLVGACFDAATIRNCGVTGTVSGVDRVGGIVGSQGLNRHVNIISNCYAVCIVSGEDEVGGLVGRSQNGHARIENCYAQCNVTGVSGVGGLVGRNLLGATIDHCYAVSTVQGTSYVGGLVGAQTWDSDMTYVTHSFAASSVTGQENVGGILGNYEVDNMTSECFWDFTASGLSDPDVYALDTATLQSRLYYITHDWNTSNLWTIDDGHDYPRLALQGAAGEMIPGYAPENIPLTGSGTVEDPFQISNAADLAVLNTGGLLLEQHYAMTADINTAGIDIAPIGGIDGYPFKGSLDGRGHVIWNLSISGEDCVGLFGVVENGHICNLGLENAQVSGTANCVGPLAGKLVNSILENSYCNGNTSAGEMAGGLVGFVSGGRILNCYSAGHVTGDTAAGIASLAAAAEMRNCYSVCTIAGGELGSLTLPAYCTVANSFYITEYAELILDIPVGRKITQDQMKSLHTFRFNRWTDGSWVIDDGQDYPRLTWQGTPGVIITSPEPNDIPFPGLGTEAAPFQIDEPNDLEFLTTRSYFWDKHLELVADINMVDREHIPIGPNPHEPFTGYFDGHGFTICNLTIHGIEDVGLFGCTADGRVTSLILEDVGISCEDSGTYLGAVVGLNLSATIENCYSTGHLRGNLSAGTHFFAISAMGGIAGCNSGLIRDCYSECCMIEGGRSGGIAGSNQNGTVEACQSNCLIETSGGGIAGATENATITNCKAIVQIHGNNSGGLVGIVNEGSLITNSFALGEIQGESHIGGLYGLDHSDEIPIVVEHCYSMVNVAGDRQVGGLVGYSRGGVQLRCCYATGHVSGNSDIGGAIGYLEDPTDVEGCFWDMETSGLTTSPGGLGLTSEQMKTSLIYIINGWAEEGYWTINEGLDYPRLAWEQMPGVIMPPFAPDNISLDGEGTAESPFLITSAYDLTLVQNGNMFRDKHLRMTADIDLDGTLWVPIGPDSAHPFTGSLDGNGHIIRNLTVQGDEYLGLFGYIKNGLITSLGIEDVNVVGTGDNIGVIAGYAELSTITRCYTTGCVHGHYNVGGLVGMILKGDILDCYSECIVDGTSYVGGLVGTAQGYGCTLDNCLAFGSTTGVSQRGVFVGSIPYGDIYHSFWSIDSNYGTTPQGLPLDANDLSDPYIFMAHGWGEDSAWMIDSAEGRPRLSWEPVAGNTVPAIASEGSPFGGSGTPEDPFVISDANTLAMLSYGGILMDKHYIQTADINTSGHIFESIGSLEDRFAGTFDGCGYTIENLTVSQNGMFGCAYEATLKNIRLENVAVVGTDGNVGGLVGKASELDVTGCSITGTVAGNTYVGGLIGYSNRGTIDNCTFTGTVIGNTYTGGLFGYSSDTITHCSTICDIQAQSGPSGGICGDHHGRMTDCYANACLLGGSSVGGIVGYNSGRLENSHADCEIEATSKLGGLCGYHIYGSNPIYNCSAAAIIRGQEEIGGLVGYNGGYIHGSCATGSVNGLNKLGGLCGANIMGRLIDCYCQVDVVGSGPAGSLVGGFCGESSISLIRNCYSASTIEAEGSAAGFIGYNTRTYEISGCFFDYQTSGIFHDDNATALSTSEMLQLQTYLDAGWDFVNETDNGVDNVWDICEGMNYPRLAWQKPVADIVCPYGVGFLDYVVLATNFADVNGPVDFNDLAVLFDAWLDGATPPVSLTGVATNPIPADGAVGLTESTTLQWTAPEDFESFNVYFGIDPNLVFMVNTTTPSFDPGPLDLSRHYVWRIDTVNSDGIAVGAIWDFATIACATNPVPANETEGSLLAITLEWTPVADALSHNVYFGTTNPPEFKDNTTAISFDPGPLQPTQQYYWRIDEVMADEILPGSVWTFNTRDGASNPIPANGATRTSGTLTLSWTPALTAESHNVYFGMTNPPVFRGNITETSFDTGPLEDGWHYYWRIDEVTADGTLVGAIWSFYIDGGR